MAGLNRKQELFCQYYAQTGNATESYKRAGYGPTTDNAAGVSARRLLYKDKIQARLAEITRELDTDRVANVREVQERLTAILRGEQPEEQVVVEGCGDGISQARIVKRAPQLKDSIRAGELLARMQGGLDASVSVNVRPVVFVEDLEE